MLDVMSCVVLHHTRSQYWKGNPAVRNLLKKQDSQTTPDAASKDEVVSRARSDSSVYTFT